MCDMLVKRDSNPSMYVLNNTFARFYGISNVLRIRKSSSLADESSLDIVVNKTNEINSKNQGSFYFIVVHLIFTVLRYYFFVTS